MFLRNQRILMNAADVGGNSAPVPAVTAPSEVPASTAPAPLDDATRRAIVDETRNSVFAELRRTGQLNEKKTTTKPAEPGAPAAPVNLRSLDRAITRAGRTPDERAYARLERAFTEEAPSDPDGWLAEYFSGLGVAIASSPAAPAVNAAAPLVRSAAPVSGGGSPPAPRASLEEADIMSLSSADRDLLIKQKGPRWYMAKIAEQTKGQSVRLK